MTAPSPAPYPYFSFEGTALDGGKIYVGAANLDPRTNPITVYQDAADTITWAQPLRTVAGYPAAKLLASLKSAMQNRELRKEVKRLLD